MIIHVKCFACSAELLAVKAVFGSCFPSFLKTPTPFPLVPLSTMPSLNRKLKIFLQYYEMWMFQEALNFSVCRLGLVCFLISRKYNMES